MPDYDLLSHGTDICLEYSKCNHYYFCTFNWFLYCYKADDYSEGIGKTEISHSCIAKTIISFTDISNNNYVS
jgi:hypothetical protein